MEPKGWTLGLRPLPLAAIAFAVGIHVQQTGPWGHLSFLLIPVIPLIFWALGAPRLARVLFGAGLVFVIFASTGWISSRSRTSIATPTIPALGRSEALEPAQRAEPLLVEGIIETAPRNGHRPKTQVFSLGLLGFASAQIVGAQLRPAQGRVQLTSEGRCGAPGDRIRALVRLRWPLGARAPGDFDRELHLKTLGVELIGRTLPGSVCTVLHKAERRTLAFTMERLRDALHAAIDRGLSKHQQKGAVVRAFATGDGSALSPKVKEDFIRSGLMHLLAVSGLNLAIVSGVFCILLFRLFKRSPTIALGFGARRSAAAVAIPFVGLYALLVGASPSAVRAALMVGAVLSAELFFRRADGPSSLALAVLIMLAVNPFVLYSASFQLSLAGVLSLLLIYPRLRGPLSARLSSAPLGVAQTAEVVLATAAATLGTMPVVAHHFGRLSLIGLLANLPAAPLSSFVLVPLSGLGGMIAIVCPTLGDPILEVARLAGALLTLIARWSARVPFATVPVPGPNVLETVLLVGALFGFTLRTQTAPGGRVRRALIASCVALLLSLPVLRVLAPADRTLTATFLPVGQGDAIVLHLPGRKTLLIDCGPPGAHRIIASYLRKKRIDSIEAVILTHPHADHIGGLAELSAGFRIKEVWWTQDKRHAPPELLEAVRSQNTRLSRVGDEHKFGQVTITVLGPGRPAPEYAEVNDGSIVLMVKYGQRRLLLTGDAEQEAEAELVALYGEDLRADVLKAGHHGSKTSSTWPFLRSASPAHVVISAGVANRFGFPHKAVLHRLQRLPKAQIWRTDRQGAITVKTDGVQLSVQARFP